jgi:uncharacterized protein (TIGR02246 family)
MSKTDHPIRQLYERLLVAWNQRDAAAMASVLSADGVVVGFDGSQSSSRQAFEDHLRAIFADHQTGPYVGIIRDVRPLTPGVAQLQAVSGLAPPGQEDVNPATNSIQTLVAVRRGDEWQVALFQTTPAAWHGRSHDRDALTEELRDVLRRGLTCL